MDRKIRLLAACSVAALTTVACAPNAGTYAPHNQQTFAGSTTAPVTHSHSGKVHSHPLPATGIRHTHTMGGSNTGGATQQQQPTGNNSGGTTHSHSGRTHSHNLPASGLNHTHRMGGGSAAQTQQVPQANNYTPPVANNNQGGQAHSHNGKVHSHPLPASGLNHGHNMGGASAPANNVPAAQNPYTVPTAQSGNSNGAVTHSHNGRTHSHRLPASGTNHAHRGIAGNTQQQPQNNSGSSYYDTATNNNYVPPANNSNNDSYYDYSDQGGNSTYYDTARPKGSVNYQPQPKPNTGSFAPENYAGGSNTYTVKRGDTVFQVMRNTGVYWKDIIRLNNLQAPNYQINPGQRLRLR